MKSSILYYFLALFTATVIPAMAQEASELPDAPPAAPVAAEAAIGGGTFYALPPGEAPGAPPAEGGSSESKPEGKKEEKKDEAYKGRWSTASYGLGGASIMTGTDKRVGGALDIAYINRGSQILGTAYISGRPADGVVTDPNGGVAGRFDGVRLHESKYFYVPLNGNIDLSAKQQGLEAYIGFGAPIRFGDHCFVAPSTGPHGQVTNDTMVDGDGKGHSVRSLGWGVGINGGCEIVENLQVGLATTLSKPILVPQSGDATRASFEGNASLFANYMFGKDAALTLRVMGQGAVADWKIDDSHEVRGGVLGGAGFMLGYGAVFDAAPTPAAKATK